jgi:hypothetical protein
LKVADDASEAEFEFEEGLIQIQDSDDGGAGDDGDVDEKVKQGKTLVPADRKS